LFRTKGRQTSKEQNWIQTVPGKGWNTLHREKPFRAAGLRSRPPALRRIADKLIDRAEEGDLASIRELIDCLDGRPLQMIDRHDLPLTKLTDAELLLIASGGRAGNEPEMKVISPPKD
jgi:hypothetical protein